jgi:hypothetical protein
VGNRPVGFVAIGAQTFRFGSFKFSGPDDFLITKQFDTEAPKGEANESDKIYFDPLTNLGVSEFIVLLGRRVTIKRETRSIKNSETEDLELLITAPQKLLGTAIESNNEHRTLVSPDGSALLSASVDRRFVRNIAESVAALGATVVRIQSTMFALLNLALGHAHTHGAGKSFGVVVVDQGYVAWMKVNDAGQWGDFRLPPTTFPVVHHVAAPNPAILKAQEALMTNLASDLKGSPAFLLDTGTSAFDSSKVDADWQVIGLPVPHEYADVFAASRL